MANSQITTSEVTDSASFAAFYARDYFTYPAIFSLMADSVKKHDPQLFLRCASAIDMGHTCTLRGLSYLGRLLADDENVSEMQRSIAGETIAEITAFVAALIEMQNDAEMLRDFPKECGVQPLAAGR